MKKNTAHMLILVFLLVASKPLIVAAAETTSTEVAAVNANGEKEVTKKVIISTDDKSKGNDSAIELADGQEHVRLRLGGSRQIEDVVVPIAFFLFLLTLILGRRFLSERTQQKKVALLEKMIEKGHPVSENIIQQVFTNNVRSERWGGNRKNPIRRGVALTLIGVGLLINGAFFHLSHTSVTVGIVMLGLGIGFLASSKFDKTNSADLK